MSRHPGTAVVTGGSAGNGRAIARALAARGHDVAVLARDSKRLRETEDELHGYGVHARGISCDVADAGQVEEAAKRAETELGPIAVWVNNAMTTVIAPFSEMETRDIQRITDVNYMGYVHGMQSALRRMKPRDRGTIVNIGSGLSYRGIPLQTAYCATKAAIKNLTEGVRAELFHDGSAVHLGMVMPPAVNTPQFAWAKTTMPKLPQAVPPIYQPEIIAEAVLKLIDDQSREIFVGGSTVQVWAGEQILPNAMGHVLAGKKGYASQQSDRPATQANEEGNLYQPVEMDVAAHGYFDDKAKTDAVILDADNTRLGLVLGGALALFGLGALIGRATKSDDGAAGAGRDALPAPQEERLGGAPAAVPPG
ncbi:SDR family oxidoreductase [Parvularcula oceani]|uniref:SDR family oxidoreductase n=1 Tax=Parvularcula oceani TaxID=1247963 RepID=UPI0009DE0E0C|nr:SDR family oxidoreductase [Parvularcula oceani]